MMAFLEQCGAPLTRTPMALCSRCTYTIFVVNDPIIASGVGGGHEIFLLKSIPESRKFYAVVPSC